MWARAENRGAALSAEGEITRPSGRSAMAEESLGMVIFKRLHPAGTPRETGGEREVNTMPFGLIK